MKRFKVLLATLALVLSCNSYAAQDVILASAVRTGTTTSADIYRTVEHGAHFVFVITAVPGVDTVTPKIQGKDALGNYYDILIGTALVATGTTVLKIYPGIGAVANGASPDILPDVYRVVVTHSAGTSFTYTMTANKDN